MLHGFIAPCIKKKSHTTKPKKRDAAASLVASDALEVQPEAKIADMVAIAKNNDMDIVTLLKSYMPVVEVAI